MNNLDIDAQIREALTPPNDQVELVYSRFTVGLGMPQGVGRAERSRRTRRRRIGRALVVATAVAVSVSAAMASLPFDERSSNSGRGISLAPTASAAEALDWAADAVLGVGASKAPAIWHSSSSTRENGRIARFEERWYDPAAGRFSSIVGEHYGDSGAVLWTVDFDGERTIARSYRRDASGRWGLNSTGPNLNIEGVGLPDVEVAVRTNAWLAVASANPSHSQLDEATERFFSTTEEAFRLPGMGPDSGANTRVRQAAFLLSAASASPQAMSAVYASIAEFDDLKRLDANSGELRIELEDTNSLPYSDAIRPRVQSVAILDADTGLPLRFESMNRSVVRTLTRGDDVDALGAKRAACGPSSDFLPCGIFEQGSALRRQADEFAGTPSSTSKADAWRRGVSTDGA